MTVNDTDIIQAFRDFISDEAYPCVAARAATSRGHIPCFVAGHMACPTDDEHILQFLYDFIPVYRSATRRMHSAAVIFRAPEDTTSMTFEEMLWSRLQALSSLDAKRYAYDPRVSQDPTSADFSFSVGEEAFFVIGLHPGSERTARRFAYPAIVFNPHAQFEEMRKAKQYEKMKDIVRKRDILYSGSVNPMLRDFGKESEVYQYSGRRYDNDWTCPLKTSHARPDDHRTPE